MVPLRRSPGLSASALSSPEGLPMLCMCYGFLAALWSPVPQGWPQICSGVAGNIILVPLVFPWVGRAQLPRMHPKLHLKESFPLPASQ